MGKIHRGTEERINVGIKGRNARLAEFTGYRVFSYCIANEWLVYISIACHLYSIMLL